MIPLLDVSRAPARAHAGGAADFNALIDPGSPTYNQDFTQAWRQVQTQMQAEGVPQGVLSAAAGPMADAFTQASQGLGVSSADAARGAKDAILIGKTALGAVHMVSGLIGQAQGVDDAQTAVAFSGSLITTIAALGVSAGAFTAGAGAAITAVAVVSVDILESILPPKPVPRGVQVYPGFYCENVAFTTGTPGLPSAGCVVPAAGSKGTAAPSSINWRSFPKDDGNSADAAWFRAAAVVGRWGPGGPSAPTFVTPAPDWGARPIDWAFLQYKNIECDQGHLFAGRGSLPVAIVPFMQGWTAAWKANAEYSLNGLGAQPDAMALLHYLRVWNNSHEPGAGFDVWPNPAIDPSRGKGCDPSSGTYLESLIYDVLSNASAEDSFVDKTAGAVRIYTGSAKTPPDTGAGVSPGRVVPIRLGPMGPSYDYWSLDQWANHYLGPAPSLLQVSSLAKLGGLNLRVRR